MMTGEYLTLTRNPTAHNHPSWLDHPDPTATIFPPSSSSSSPLRPSPLSVTTTATPGNYDAVLSALCRYIQASDPDGAVVDLAAEIEESGVPIDGAYASTDEFRMYEFKVRPCTRAKAHDWTECPFAHPGEKARRRDPLRFPYSGTACTDFRKGSCRRGDSCEFAHGVFECWLHPTRYRTQACKDGSGCTRRVCFFAHSPDQLRVVSGQPSPRSIPGPDPFEDLELSSSPPVTPIGRQYGVNEMVASLRNLQLNKVKSMPTRPGWGVHMGSGSGSPRFGPMSRPGFYSLPNTPTRPAGGGYFDVWEEEEPVMERVESGRELRARMFEKLGKENPLSLPEPAESGGSGPDVGWVTELVK